MVLFLEADHVHADDVARVQLDDVTLRVLIPGRRAQDVSAY